ncbi:sensor histidine kinase, partial [Sphaerobacter thermophilus]|uniref:sensor histidine kinase n=1 Tax=Sphaerobacter thermophilus TaxID=2057 RepID=UPI0039C192EB
LTPVAADIRRVAEQVIARLRTQAEPKKLDIRIEIPDGLTPGRFDPERIEQVLVNLVHNAVKFTPPGGIITVGAAAEDDHLVVWVADTGPGVAPEDRDRIFERFYKTDRSRADAGTGLGLSIARHLVELHGGRIWVDGTARPGTTIKFTLPLALEPAPTGDSTPSAHRA